MPVVQQLYQVPHTTETSQKKRMLQSMLHRDRTTSCQGRICQATPNHLRDLPNRQRTLQWNLPFLSMPQARRLNRKSFAAPQTSQLAAVVAIGGERGLRLRMARLLRALTPI